MVKIPSERFRVRPGTKLELDREATQSENFYRSKSHYQKLLQSHMEELERYQELLYATSRCAVLLIFQAMDAAGKDGVIRHVMSGVNPQGCQVFSFQHPSDGELKHDFLWRNVNCLPERGRIGIFNRSYYEEVLIVRVHPEILRSEGVLETPEQEKEIWTHRYQSISELERHLHRNGTRILKFFLHMSKEEQRRRLLERFENPAKNWKLHRSDLMERQFWSAYLKAYEACISATSTEASPWYVIPADDKENARLIISQTILDLFKGLHLALTPPDRERRDELQSLHDQLRSEDPNDDHASGGHLHH
jgi:PPK2 family polyphosphate:nucleotide phosphotransferase